MLSRLQASSMWLSLVFKVKRILLYRYTFMYWTGLYTCTVRIVQLTVQRTVLEYHIIVLKSQRINYHPAFPQSGPNPGYRLSSSFHMLPEVEGHHGSHRHKCDTWKSKSIDNRRSTLCCILYSISLSSRRRQQQQQEFF